MPSRSRCSFCHGVHTARPMISTSTPATARAIHRPRRTLADGCQSNLASIRCTTTPRTCRPSSATAMQTALTMAWATASAGHQRGGERLPPEQHCERDAAQRRPAAEHGPPAGTTVSSGAADSGSHLDGSVHPPEATGHPRAVLLAPSERFELPHTVPETDALSPELRGRGSRRTSPRYRLQARPRQPHRAASRGWDAPAMACSLVSPCR